MYKLFKLDMQGGKNKKNIRRCGLCGAMGHNKSTCSAIPQSAPQTLAKPPLQFFVHHVPTPLPTSPHVINLKNKPNPWDSVAAEAPQESTAPKYHFYHKLPIIEPEKTFSDASPLPQKNIFVKLFKIITSLFSKLKSTIRNLHVWSVSERVMSPQRHPLGPASPVGGFAAEKSEGTAKRAGLSHPNWFTKFAPKFAGAALAVILILILPSAAKTYYQNVHDSASVIASTGLNGFSALEQSLAALIRGDLTRAETLNDTAAVELASAADLLRTTHPILQTIASGLPIVGSKIKSGTELLLAGQELTLGNAKLFSALEAASSTSSTLLERFTLIAGALRLGLPHYASASVHLNNVDAGDLPESYQDTLPIAKQLLTGAVNDLTDLTNLESTLQEIFGAHGQRRYLIIFQNQHEIRPTGGFMGSFAIADFDNGKMVNLEIPPGGTYDLQGQLDKYLIPPTPLSLANKRWEFQDANWFPDFPSSAEKILWFYRHSRGVSADGVIAINSSVLERLLALTGPLPVPGRDLSLSAETALSVLQNIIETGPEKQDHKPKQVLTDAAPILLASLQTLPAETSLALMSMLNDALNQKDIQAYFTNEDAQKTVERYGWSGKILPTSASQDYLMVINSNIQSGKSDLNIEQTINHEALVQEDGSIVDTVTITRRHQGQGQSNLYGLTNIDYLRLYVPQGSELLSASGFSWPDEKLFRVPDKWSVPDETLQNTEQEIKIDAQTGTRVTKEFGKYAFGNWVITEPGEISQVQFTYRLPFKAWALPNSLTQSDWQALATLAQSIGRYQLVAQRQSGSPSTFSSQIVLPLNWTPTWQDGPNITTAANGIKISLDDFNQDTIWSLAIKQKN